METFYSGMDLAAHIREVYESMPRCSPNNFTYVQAWWEGAAEDEVAVAVETDGMIAYQNGVTQRMPSENMDYYDVTTNGYSFPEALVVTNHSLKRCQGNPKANACKNVPVGSRERYETAWNEIRTSFLDNQLFNLDGMQQIMQAIGETYTAQTTYAEAGKRAAREEKPSQLTLHVSFRQGDTTAPYFEPFHLSWQQMFTER